MPDAYEQRRPFQEDGHLAVPDCTCRDDHASWCPHYDQTKHEPATAAPPQEPQTGAEMIAAERHRQVSGEGWTPEHDDQHTRWELTRAAIAYLREAKGRRLNHVPSRDWPWHDGWWKPTERIDDLVKAGALIAAEIDRLQRKERPHA